MEGETMETKIKPKRITDFKNDLVFKFMLSDLNDSRCYYILKVDRKSTRLNSSH